MSGTGIVDAVDTPVGMLGINSISKDMGTANQVFPFSQVPAGTPIRYTTDDTEPLGTSTQYTIPLHITETTTVKAKFFPDFYPNPSAMSQETYTKLMANNVHSDVITTKLKQSYVAVKDGDNIICLTINPASKVGWTQIGVIAYEPSMVHSLLLVEEGYGSLLLMVQLNSNVIKRYRSTSQGEVWIDVTSELS